MFNWNSQKDSPFFTVTRSPVHLNIWLIIELNLCWSEIKVSAKYPITSNTLNSIWPKEHQMENKMLFRLNYWVHPLNWLFTFSNKAIKRFIFMKNTFVLLEGGSSRCKLPLTVREIRSKRWRLWHKTAQILFQISLSNGQYKKIAYLFASDYVDCSRKLSFGPRCKL